MLRLGLLGCGRIGQVHARSLSRMKEARLVAAADAMAEAAAALATEHGAEARSVDGIIGADDIDAVIIGTPTDTHFDLIHAAAGAGQAIFCEKPVDLSVARSAACVKAAEEAGVPFMVAFQRRFDPNMGGLARRVHAGEIGAVELVTIFSRDPGPPPLDYIRRSGGIFRDMMIHDLDMARFLLGEEPVEVFATGTSLVDPEIGAAGDVDTAAAMLRTASGRICQISNSRRAAYGHDQRVEVHGSKGLLRVGNVLESTVELANGAGFRRAPAQHFFLERYEAAYLAEMIHFVEAVTGGKPVSPNGEDGVRAQVLADLATRSWETGKPQAVPQGAG